MLSVLSCHPLSTHTLPAKHTAPNSPTQRFQLCRTTPSTRPPTPCQAHRQRIQQPNALSLSHPPHPPPTHSLCPYPVKHTATQSTSPALSTLSCAPTSHTPCADSLPSPQPPKGRVKRCQCCRAAHLHTPMSCQANREPIHQPNALNSLARPTLHPPTPCQAHREPIHRPNALSSVAPLPQAIRSLPCPQPQFTSSTL